MHESGLYPNTMDYSTLSLIELKQAAKSRGNIKQYYIMKRLELIEILSLSELPEEMQIQKKTIKTLREEAKSRGIKGFWTLHRAELVDLLYSSGRQGEKAPADKNEKNECDAHEHNDPQEHDA